MVGEGGDDGGAEATSGGGIERKPAHHCSSVWELFFSNGGPHETLDHEAQVAGMGGGSHGVGHCNGSNVGWEDGGGFEKSGREAEKSSKGGGGSGEEMVVPSMVEVD